MPEPETPVTTVNVPKGILTSTFFKLLLQAPLMEINFPFPFFLSLGIDIKTKKTKYRSTKHKNDLTQQFHLVYQNIMSFHLHQRDKYYIKAFQSFLNLMPLIGFKWEDLEEAYYKKLKVNYQRQDNNY